jgi:hypothetical protein
MKSFSDLIVCIIKVNTIYSSLKQQQQQIVRYTYKSIESQRCDKYKHGCHTIRND